MRFTPKTTELLIKSGWDPYRWQNIDELAEIYCARFTCLPPVIYRFLQEFSGLKVYVDNNLYSFDFQVKDGLLMYTQSSIDMRSEDLIDPLF